MKSCLKNTTPPYSPDISEPLTPGGCTGRPRLQKTVSFCREDELEEVFEVDEWDRSPMPVTPRLSYEDVLELKKLRLSLPRPAPPPTYRQPFTTSSPSAYTAAAASSSSRSFPYSRFATQPSQTPSKWKNRGTTPPPDPEILPYLDAVPIRLLPLLDASITSEPPSPQLLAEAEPIARVESPPHPQPAPSTPAPPVSLPLSTYSPPGRTDPPSLPSPSTPTPISIPSPPPARRLPTFAFVPLLPAQPSPTPTPPKPTHTLTQSQRRINMTFLPLAASPPPVPVPPPSLPETTQLEPLPSSVLPNQSGTDRQDSKESEGESELAPTPTLAPIAEPSPPSVLSTSSAASAAGSSCSSSVESIVEFPDTDADEPDGYSDLPPRALSPTDLSTPALSSASESDTDEHDGDTDGDAEEDRHLSNVGGYGTHTHSAIAQYEYFAARLQASSAGQTPPLSSIYPEVHPVADDHEESRVGMERSVGMGMRIGGLPLHMQMEMPVGMAAMKKVKLAALPSPALAPPSPFSLYPPSPDASSVSPFVPREARDTAVVDAVRAARKAVAVEEQVLAVASASAEGEAAALEVEIERLAVTERMGAGDRSSSRDDAPGSLTMHGSP